MGADSLMDTAFASLKHIPHHYSTLLPTEQALISVEWHNEFFHEKSGGPPTGRRSAGEELLGEAAAYSAGASVTATMRPSP